jgi:bacteriocin-like protein
MKKIEELSTEELATVDGGGSLLQALADYAVTGALVRVKDTRYRETPDVTHVDWDR